MARRQKPTHDQPASEEKPVTRSSDVIGVPKSNLPNTYFAFDNAVLEELVNVWNKLFRRRKAS